MPHALTIDLCGERLTLLAGRGLYWPRRRVLLIADPHFGKAAAFRRAGALLPAGDLEDDLAALGAMLDATGARQLAILGDFFHAAAGRDTATMAALAAWRVARPRLGLTLVRGNHDRHAGDPPAEWAMDVHDEPLAADPFTPPFVLAHEHASVTFPPRSEPPAEPRAAPRAGEPIPDKPGAPLAGADTPAGYVLAGHVHPAVMLREASGLTLRLPCFYFTEHYGLLPAFGRFTGTHALRPTPGGRVYVLGEGEVMAVPLH